VVTVLEGAWAEGGRLGRDPGTGHSVTVPDDERTVLSEADFSMEDAGDGWWPGAPPTLTCRVVEGCALVRDGLLLANRLVRIQPSVGGSDLVLVLDDGAWGHLPDGSQYTAGIPAYLVRTPLRPDSIENADLRAGIKVGLRCLRPR
jgi:hypothetical protein